jgi:peptide deformylase
MKLELIPYDDPILHQKTQPFDFENPPHDPAELVAAMNALVEEKNGLGLACPQVGIPFAMFVMRGGIACFNPVIVTLSNELIRLDEGCLSYPGLSLSIERSRHLRLRYQDAKGATETATYANMTARCVLHEMDHLDGIVFLEKVSKLRLDMAIRKARKHSGKIY